MVNNPFDDLLKNTPFGSMKRTQSFSPFNDSKEEKKEELVKESEQQTTDANTATVEIFQTETENEAEESVDIAPDKNTTNEDSFIDADDNEDTPEANNKEEEPKKKRRKRRTKAEMEEARKAEELSSSAQDTNEVAAPLEKVNNVKEEETQEQQTIDTKSVGSNYKKVDINVIKEYLAPNIDDPEWDEQVEYIEKELAKLKKFDSEINEGSIRIMVPLYANLGLYVAPMRSEYKAMLAILEDKDSGLISYQKAVNAVGANEAMRKTKAFESCGNYKVADMKNPIDLIDYTHLIRYRYEYLDGVMQQIDIAKSALISFLTVISKIEK